MTDIEELKRLTHNAFHARALGFVPDMAEFAAAATPETLQAVFDRLEAAEDAAERYEKRYVCAEATLAAIMPRWEAAEKDAEMYRWVREHHAEMMQWRETGVWYPFDGKVPERLDAAIAAELAKERG